MGDAFKDFLKEAAAGAIYTGPAGGVVCDVCHESDGRHTSYCFVPVWLSTESSLDECGEAVARFISKPHVRQPQPTFSIQFWRKWASRFRVNQLREQEQITAINQKLLDLEERTVSQHKGFEALKKSVAAELPSLYQELMEILDLDPTASPWQAKAQLKRLRYELDGAARQHMAKELARFQTTLSDYVQKLGVSLDGKEQP